MSLFQHILTTVVLVILNWSIYREVRKRTKWLEKNITKNPKTDYRRREITIALLLVTVILVFLVCHALRCFVSLIELLAVIFGKTTPLRYDYLDHHYIRHVCVPIMGFLLEHHGASQPLASHSQLLLQHPHLLCQGQTILGRMFEYSKTLGNI